MWKRFCHLDGLNNKNADVLKDFNTEESQTLNQRQPEASGACQSVSSKNGLVQRLVPALPFYWNKAPYMKLYCPITKPFNPSRYRTKSQRASFAIFWTTLIKVLFFDCIYCIYLHSTKCQNTFKTANAEYINHSFLCDLSTAWWWLPTSFWEKINLLGYLSVPKMPASTISQYSCCFVWAWLLTWLVNCLSSWRDGQEVYQSLPETEALTAPP